MEHKIMRQSAPKGGSGGQRWSPQGWNLWFGKGRLIPSTDYSAHSLLPRTGATCLQYLLLPSRAAYRQSNCAWRLGSLSSFTHLSGTLGPPTGRSLGGDEAGPTVQSFQSQGQPL